MHKRPDSALQPNVWLVDGEGWFAAGPDGQPMLIWAGAHATTDDLEASITLQRTVVHALTALRQKSLEQPQAFRSPDPERKRLVYTLAAADGVDLNTDSATPEDLARWERYAGKVLDGQRTDRSQT